MLQRRIGTMCTSSGCSVSTSPRTNSRTDRACRDALRRSRMNLSIIGPLSISTRASARRLRRPRHLRRPFADRGTRRLRGRSDPQARSNHRLRRRADLAGRKRPPRAAVSEAGADLVFQRESPLGAGCRCRRKPGPLHQPLVPAQLLRRNRRPHDLDPRGQGHRARRRADVRLRDGRRGQDSLSLPAGLRDSPVNAVRHVIYLHGFTSSPSSSKAQRFARELAARGVTFACPDFNQPSFETLTVTRMLDQTAEAIAARAGGARGAHWVQSRRVCRGARRSRRRERSPPRRSPDSAGAGARLRRQSAAAGWATTTIDEWRRAGRLTVFHHAAHAPREIRFALYRGCRAVRRVDG